MPVRRVVFHPGSDRLLLFSVDDEGGLCAWTLHPPNTSKTPKAQGGRGGSKTDGAAPVSAHPLKNHMGAVTGLAFSRDLNKLVSVSRDKVLNVWDLTAFRLLHTLPVFEVRTEVLQESYIAVQRKH